MRKDFCLYLVALIALIVASKASAQELTSKLIKDSVREPDVNAVYWRDIQPVTVTLMAQPMIAPRPEVTTTDRVNVKSVHDDEWIAFHLTWKDDGASYADRLAQFSDAAALQFPIQDKEVPPPVFMGAKGDPVHIFHWRAQYQKDVEKGKSSMKDIYPNLNIDIYPMEYPDWGSYKEATDEQREVYSPGKAAGNPQAYQKTGVDEIFAEGFSTSSVQAGHGSRARGENKNGEWNLVIARKLDTEGGSVLKSGADSHIAFAIWQGAKAEVGSRKSVAMSWTKLKVE